jgi:hypothetical protein
MRLQQPFFYAAGPEKLKWEGYDADPYQCANLVGQPEQTNLQARLDALLKDQLAKQHDDFRPGSEYVAKWGYQVDADETVRYEP